MICSSVFRAALGVTVMLAASLANAHAAPVAEQLRFVIQPNAAASVWLSHPNLKFQKSGECIYSTAPSTAWPVAPSLVGGSGKATAPLFNPGFPNPDGTYIPGSNDDGFNTLFLPATFTAETHSVACRGAILVNGIDVTLDTPSRTVTAPLTKTAAVGPPYVTLQLDTAKLAILFPPAVTTPKPNGPPVLAGMMPQLPSGPKVHAQGSANNLPVGTQVDLDTGTVSGGTGDFGVDQIWANGYVRIVYYNGAQGLGLIPVEKKDDYAECVSGKGLQPANYGVPNGSRICVRTSDGRLAELFFDGVASQTK
jgi:hypothetical protein